MGLSVSHDAWDGSYGAFMRWRRYLATAAGFSLDDMAGFTSERPVLWESLNIDPHLRALLDHSDCEGDIAVEHLEGLATELERLAALMALMMEEAGPDGHIRRWMWRATLQFATGCRSAKAANEPLEFY